LTEKEIYDARGIAIEPYAGGFILADYSGRNGPAAYRGVSSQWRSQPIVGDPFATKESAIEAAAAL
jgi:hypothetical protein